MKEFTVDFLANGIEAIVKQHFLAEGKKFIDTMKSYFKKHPWPSSINKEMITNSIDLLLEEKLPAPSASEVFTDLMMLQTRSAPKISANRKKLLKELKEIILTSKTVKCIHLNSNLGIAPFIHGGGFTPTFAAPELICLNCGANVTLFPGRKLEKEFGIKISKKDRKKIDDWVKECEKNSHKTKKFIRSSSNLPLDPIGEYQKSIQWKGEIPITIVNTKLFDSKSGT